VAFGGAGPQHACGVAALLGITRVLVPADAGLLSALGLDHAAAERFAHRQVLEPLDACRDRIGGMLGELIEQARTELVRAGLSEARTEVRSRRLHLRLVGQDSVVEVEVDADHDPAPAFAAAYQRRYGYPPPERPVELESIRVAVAEVTEPAPNAEPPPERPSPTPVARRPAVLGDGTTETTVYERSDLPPGCTVAGPALVLEPHSTTVLPPGWTARVDGAAALELLRGEEP
jgi:5-oxoprolinase (ATP-hydrolysing)